MLLLILSWVGLSAKADEDAAQESGSSNTTFNHATAFSVAPPLGELVDLPRSPQWAFQESPPYRPIPKPTFAHVADEVQQGTSEAPGDYDLVVHGLGVGNGFPNYTVTATPPDTNMAVGGKQILQWVNVSFTWCPKAGPFPGSCVSPAMDGNILWKMGLPGTLCGTNNSGDPIAQYDRAAGRWLLFQNVFQAPYAVCVAVSNGDDLTTTGWKVWQFAVPAFNGTRGLPDYPKWGIWSTGGVSDGYYQTINDYGPDGGFRGALVCAYNRAALLAGKVNPGQICHHFKKSDDSLLPADVDSPTPPPATEDAFFIGSVAANNDNSTLSLYSCGQENWAAGTMVCTGDGNSQLLKVSKYNGPCNGSFEGDCVPQKGVNDELESVGDRLMYRFAYWKDPPPANEPPCSLCLTASQHWFVNHSVGSNSGKIGVRWYELRQVLATVTAAQLAGTGPYQQGTYVGNPADENYRWMGSIARDKAGDILLGYSESSDAIFPSVAAAGQKVGGGLGVLAPELLYVNGTGSQEGSRWGDYSAMRIDPSDGCTFWFTTEYYMVTQERNWSTDIAAIKFANCGSDD